MTPGSLWSYYRDKVNNDANKGNGDGNRINKNKATTSRFFEHKTKIIGRTSITD